MSNISIYGNHYNGLFLIHKFICVFMTILWLCTTQLTWEPSNIVIVDLQYINGKYY